MRIKGTVKKGVGGNTRLQKFIRDYTVEAFARDLQISKNCTYEWLSLKKVPTFKNACAIIRLSKTFYLKGLSFNDVFSPFEE